VRVGSSNRALLCGPSTLPLGVTLMATLQYRRPPRPPDLETRITYLLSRGSSAPSGIRPMHDFGLTGELHIALHEYPESGLATPGVETKALLWLLAPDVQKDRFYPGLKFTVLEGGVVGHGDVVTVLNKELARDA
jgi:hypothetical protein